MYDGGLGGQCLRLGKDPDAPSSHCLLGVFNAMSVYNDKRDWKIPGGQKRQRSMIP